MNSELSKSIERFREEMQSVDEIAHVLLKGHLLLEEAIVRILEQYVFHRKYLKEARLQFHQRLAIARALSLRKCDLGEWDLIQAINALRNDLSHRLGSTDREAKLCRVKELYFREAAGYEGIEEIKKENDVVILFNACAHCAGFLSSFESDSRAYRRMIHGLDRAMNAELPEIEL